MNILMICFSATGNTARVGTVIREHLVRLGASVDVLDITPFSSRQEWPDLNRYPAVLVGAPIHSHRAPRVVRDWLAGLDGRGKKCATFFTFGAFEIHPTHHDTRRTLESVGFDLVGSADFPGKHTFNIGGWRAVANRPDKRDFDLAREFADRAWPRLTGKDPARPGPFDPSENTERELDDMEKFRFMVVTQLPTRQGRDCSQCGTCEDLCPTGAMNKETGEADPGLCIACLACVDSCPDEALSINDLTPVWQVKLEMEGKTEDDLDTQTGHLYF